MKIRFDPRKEVSLSEPSKRCCGVNGFKGCDELKLMIWIDDQISFFVDRDFDWEMIGDGLMDEAQEEKIEGRVIGYCGYWFF